MPEEKINLASIISKLAEKPEEIVNQKDYRYVIYARKSTDEKTHQARSLKDQIAECKKTAKQRNLKVIGKPIQEAMSAKESGVRPQFRQMLNDLKAGKFEGILAWHPDRLSRNMLEGGEIIDLIDHQIIRDLQFCTYTYERSTNGLMLLSFTFAMSKQYSDKLREDIARGTNRSLDEGKYLHKTKKGYYKDRNHYLRPDGKNFALLAEAWQMKLKNQSLDSISEYLNNRGFSKATNTGGTGHKKILMNKKKMSEIFRDPIYTGVMKYGEKVVDLKDTYNFEPMISEEDYLKINKISASSRMFKSRKKAIYGSSPSLLSKKVICRKCHKPTTICITTKHNNNDEKTKYFYFRCDTKGCKYKGKSIRAKEIIDYAINIIENWKIDNPKLYDHYVSESKKGLESGLKKIETDRKDLARSIKASEMTVIDIKRTMTKVEDSSIISSYEEDILKEIAHQGKIKREIEKLDEEENKLKNSIPSYKKFIELFKKMPDELRNSRSEARINSILSKIFSNFTVEHTKVLKHQLEPDFEELLKQGLIRNVDNTRLELVTSRM